MSKTKKRFVCFACGGPATPPHDWLERRLDRICHFKTRFLCKSCLSWSFREDHKKDWVERFKVAQRVNRQIALRWQRTAAQRARHSRGG